MSESGMSPDQDSEQAAFALDDDDAVVMLAPFYDARPARQAWRAEPDCAPFDKPV